MKNFHRRFAGIIFFLLLLCGIFNIVFLLQTDTKSSKPHIVEINRITKEMEQNATEDIDLSNYAYITHVEKYKNDSAFFKTQIPAIIFRK